MYVCMYIHLLSNLVVMPQPGTKGSEMQGRGKFIVRALIEKKINYHLNMLYYQRKMSDIAMCDTDKIIVRPLKL